MAVSSNPSSPGLGATGDGSRRPSSPPKSPVIMTPGRKIRELMAQFDSDSDNDDENAIQRHSTTSLVSPRPPAIASTEPVRAPEKSQYKSRFGFSITQSSDEDTDDDDEDVVYKPRGRMAARMLLQEDGNIDLQQTYSNIVANDTLPRLIDVEQRKPDDGRDLRGEPLPNLASTRDISQSGSDSDEHLDTDDTSIGHIAEHHSKAVANDRHAERSESTTNVSMTKDGSEADIETDDNGHGDDDDDDDVDDVDVERRLTQHSRLPRKATKSALEEMNRQTQRMSRNMQLAHNAITKKKLTLDHFLSRLNGDKRPEESTEHGPTSSAQDTGNDLAHRGSPLTSPAKATGAENSKTADFVATPDQPYDEAAQNKTNGPEIEPSPPVTDERNKTAHDISELKKPDSPAKPLPFRPATRSLRINLSRQHIKDRQATGSDDDLEIVTDPLKARRIAIFENMPIRKRQQEAESSTSIQRLRTLAQVRASTNSQKTPASTQTMKQLELDLWRRAREQAYREKEERLNALRAKGVVIETPEEISKFEDDIENLLEKARMEARDIRKQEKTKNQDPNGDQTLEAGEDDDSEDEEDYYDDDGEDDDGDTEGETEETEDTPMEVDDKVEERRAETGITPVQQPHNHGEADRTEQDGLHDDAGPQKGIGLQTNTLDNSDGAKETEHNVVDGENRSEVASDLLSVPRSPHRRTRRAAYVISDDDEDDDDTGRADSNDRTKQLPLPNHSDTEGAAIPLGLGILNQDDSELSLSQAFMDTLAEDQPLESAYAEQTSSDLIKVASDADFSAQAARISSPSAMNSPAKSFPTPQGQNGHSPTELPNLHIPSSVVMSHDSPAGRSVSKFSMAPTPTQDKGFMYSPYSRTSSVHGAQSTEQIVGTGTEQFRNSSIDVKTNRRLLRRGSKLPGSTTSTDVYKETPAKSNVFEVLKSNAKKKNKRTQAHFDKHRSEAKDIVDEVAEESDDEYAGLGGRSDDSEGEEDEEDRKMINDDDNAIVDEAELAALNAEELRHKDEAAVQKLFHDITTGALRRRRGHNGDNDIDLSDSDDERRAARRQAKRREFAKMRRALLLADDHIGKIADDPKKKAFLESLEEHLVDDSDTGLDVDKEWSGLEEPSNSEGSATISRTSQQERLPAEAARQPLRDGTQANQQAASPMEIKNAVSFLLGEPEDPSTTVSDIGREIARTDPPDEGINEDDGSDDELADSVIGTSYDNESSTQHRSGAPAQNMMAHGKYVNRWSLRRTASINAAMSSSRPTLKFENRGSITRRSPLLKGPRVSSVTPDSQRAASITEHDPSGNLASTRNSSNGGERAHGNYYAASRKRQRELELEHASGMPNKPRKLTAVIAAAKTGGNLQKWVGDKGFET